VFKKKEKNPKPTTQIYTQEFNSTQFNVKDGTMKYLGRMH